MANLRLVIDNSRPVAAPVDDRPRVSLRLLMAASGRCSCDDCLLAFRGGDRSAGLVKIPAPRRQLSAVR